MSALEPAALNHAACWRALVSRDARFDGRFFTAVRTTGIYCRPICPARTPHERNVSFHPSAAAAENAGYRPCRRCRPEAAPGSAAWAGTATTAGRALRLIAQGALDAGSVDDLSERLGISSRHLGRLMLDHAGATPIQLALTRRLHFARRLIAETALPLEEIAFASGFGSTRRFRDAFRSAFQAPPSAMRRSPRGLSTKGPFLELALPWRPPLADAALLAFLSGRAIPRCESVEGATWRTAARFGDEAGLVEARLDPAARVVRLRVPPQFAPHLLVIASRVRRMLDLDADPAMIAALLSEDPLLAPLLARTPGLRSPGAWDPFTSAVRIILGQQVSVAAATTLAGRVALQFGDPIATERPEIDRVFPDAGRLADAPLERCGLPSRRAETVRLLARAVAAGELHLVPGAPEGVERQLLAMPGIGPWTASAIAMRALGEPDAFPAGDLVIARALGGERSALLRAEAWRPFRAHAAMHLWTAAAAGG